VFSGLGFCFFFGLKSSDECLFRECLHASKIPHGSNPSVKRKKITYEAGILSHPLWAFSSLALNHPLVGLN
jgi:hypothetical protein